mgnify:CR=1 FL=1
MTSPQDDREEFGPDVDDGGTATSPDKEQADDESAAAPPEESPTQAAPAEAGDEAVASDGADELAPEEAESVPAPAGREPCEADEAGSIEQPVEHEADAPESDPVEASGEPESAPPVVASADSAGSGRQAVEPVDSEQVGSGSGTETEDPAEAGRQAGGADMADPVEPVEVEPETEEPAGVDPVEDAGPGIAESDAEPVEVEPETEDSAESGLAESAEPGRIASEADEAGADDARSEPDAVEAGPAESGAESAEPVEAESEADEPAGSGSAGLTEPEARTEGSVAPPVEWASAGSAESVPDDLEEGRIEPVEAVTDVEADEASEAPEGREAIDSRADDGRAAGDGSESVVEPHEERAPVVDEGGGAAPHEPDEEPDAADSAPEARPPAPEIDEPSPGAGGTGVVEPDAGTTARSLAAEAADASTPLPEAVSGTEEPSSHAGEPAAGAEESEPEEPIDLPPSYPPTRRPRPLPIPGREKDEDSSETRPRRGWLSTVAVVLVVLALSAFIKTHIVQTFEIPSGSMENTLQSDDQVAVRMYHAHDVHRGDVVVFADPGGWLDAEDPSGFKGLVRDGLILTGLLPRNSGHHLIKRVIGVAGDRVTADGHGVLTVNGVPLNETYVKEGTVPSSVPFDVIVPEGCVWVMGDNRSNSLDSRFHQDDPHGGAVPLKDVVGVATNVVWPVSRWSSLDNGEAVFADVSGSGP